MEQPKLIDKVNYENNTAESNNGKLCRLIIKIPKDYKKCANCEEVKELCEFSKYGTYYICKPCESIHSFSYRSTPDGFFYSLLNHAKDHAKKRREKGKIEAGKFEIDIKFMRDLWAKQEGKCFYSQISMQAKPNSNWQCSIERLDQDKGYTEENTVFACLEFNHKCQWTIDKLKRLLEEIKVKYNPNLIIEEIKQGLKRKITKERKKIVKRIINGIECYNCTTCDKYFPRKEFIKQISQGCKECRSTAGKDYRSTVKGKLNNLIKSARYSTKTREYTIDDTNRVENVCTITLEDLVETLIKQEGLCAYSGIKMSYGTHKDKDWTVSLERIDSLRGYTKDNICLICYEFNTTDHSADAKFSNGGSGQWNKEKFEYLLKSIQ